MSSRDGRTLLDNDEMNENRSDDEAEEEEDERIPLPFSGMPSRERHIADMRPPRTLGVIKRKDFVKRILFVSFVAFLGLLVILFTVVAHTLSSEDQPDTCQNVESGRYLFDPYTNEQNFRLCHSKEARLTGSLGQAIAGKGSTSVEKRREDEYQFTHSSPSVSWSLTLNASDSCVSVTWHGETSYGLPLMDCYDMSGSHWYGGYEAYNQLWSINDDNRTMQPFLSNDTYEFHDGFGSILHPVWLNSKGVLVFVDKDVPLHVSINSFGDNQLCLQSVPYALGCTPSASQNGHLSYTVCQFDHAVAALKHFLQNSKQVKNPTTIPEESVFKYPIWSMGAFKTKPNEMLVCAFANEVVQRNFSVSQLEIDDGYGNLTINPTKFHSILPKHIVNLSQRNNFGITAWVHPFVNYDADFFKDIIQEESNHLLPGGSKETTAIVKWGGGHGALINFELPNTTAWYRDKLKDFVNSNGLTALRFDAGESEYLPDCLYFPDSTHPATFSQKYIEFAAGFDWSSRSDVRVGYFTQDKPIFVRMLDRNSTWGTDNGLHSVLTTALTMSMMGYNFIIPSMIGGNGMNAAGDHTTSCDTVANCTAEARLEGCTTDIDKELYVRWLQLSVFLPVMQFSIPPWVFDDSSKLVEYTKNLINFHEVFADEHIIPAVSRTLSQMCPLIRPVWWLDPLSDEAHNCTDEFLVGDSILVAPILKKGSNQRDVYLPPGTWIECKVHDGSKPCEQGRTFPVGEGDHTHRVSITNDVEDLNLDTNPLVYFKRTVGLNDYVSTFDCWSQV